MLLVAGVLIGGAYYFGTLKNTKPQPQNPTATSQPSQSTQSSTPDKIANWKTYTNTAYGFSFKYPPLLDSKCCGLAGPLSPRHLESMITLADPSTTTEGTDKQFSGLALYIDLNPSNITFLDYLDQERASTFLDGYGCSGKKDWQEENVLIDNRNGALFKDVCMHNIIYAPLSDNRKILIIIGSEVSKNSFSVLFDQILSTFKFTDQNKTDISGWKTYTITPDSSLGYESYQIKLPIKWKQIEHSSNFQNMETFLDEQNIYKLTVEEQKNYNDQTKKPFADFRELTGLSYDVMTLMVDGQKAARPLPRAGSEYIYETLFFSKDTKLVYNITLETPKDGSKIQEGEALFNQILSTFKFTQ